MSKFIPPKKNLGASQFAAALGLNRFLTPEELKRNLEDGYVWEFNEYTEFGHDKESLGKYFYQKISGNTIKKGNLVKDIHCSRLVGICDGLVGLDGGIEIKCHYKKDSPLKSVPIYYLPQVAGYLHLYNRKWWDFMSCCFDGDKCKCRIIRVHRDDVRAAWENEWYPGLLKFVDSVEWK